jgi:hypothetical protein
MKTILISILCLGFIFSFSGCTKQLQELVNQVQSGTSAGEADEDGNIEEDAVKYSADTTYHSGYLGFSYTVPKGWWLYTLNSDNFSEDPEDSTDLATLDISYGTDHDFDYSYMRFISFANLQFSTRDNHLGFFISAETLDGINSIGEYMDYYEEYMLDLDEEYPFELLESAQEDLGGVRYEKRVFNVPQEEENYYYVCYTRSVKHGYFLTIRGSYWPENKNAEEVIKNAIAKAVSYN